MSKQFLRILGYVFISLSIILFFAVPWIQSAIQSQVGMNIKDGVVSGNPWRAVASAITDGDAQSTSSVVGTTSLIIQDVQNMSYLFNGTTWDRTRSVAGDAITTGIPTSGNYIFNGTTWDRQRELATADAAAVTGIGATGIYLFRGAGFDPMRGSALTNGEGVARVELNVTDGAVIRTLRSTGAGSLTDTTSNTTLLTAPLSTWSETDQPASNVQAIATKAAGAAGVRHVSTHVTMCLTSFNGPVIATRVNLRDGASGAGTVLWSAELFLPGSTVDATCIITPITVIGSTATAMTLEFQVAPGAANGESVTLTGYSVL